MNHFEIVMVLAVLEQVSVSCQNVPQNIQKGWLFSTLLERHSPTKGAITVIYTFPL